MQFRTAIIDRLSTRRVRIVSINLDKGLRDPKGERTLYASEDRGGEEGAKGSMQSAKSRKAQRTVRRGKKSRFHGAFLHLALYALSSTVNFAFSFFLPSFFFLSDYKTK